MCLNGVVMRSSAVKIDDLTDFEGGDTAYQRRLTEANINPKTYLATDYLNHYNEITMLLEMLPDMPDMVEECLEWRPKSYAQHFKDSGFQATDLAIEAYGLAPANVRTSFVATCDQLDTMIMRILSGLQLVGASERGLTEQAQNLVRQRVEEIQHDLMTLNKVIHGTHNDADVASAELDVKTPAVDMGESGEDTQTQADIDKLFD